MIFLNDPLIFWFLVLAVFVSTSLRFASPQRYIAILVWALSLAAFHIAVPGFLNPRCLVRLILRNRNKGGAGLIDGLPKCARLNPGQKATFREADAI